MPAMQNRRKNPAEKMGQTIHHVARDAGVSIVTVSRVFNDYPHVSEKMRKRVLHAARQIGYRPRFVTKPRVIAVIVGHLDILSAGDYKTRLMLHIVRAAAQYGHLVEFIPHDTIDLATKRLVDGVIEVGLTPQELPQLDQLPPVPVVLVNKPSSRPTWSSVSADHYLEGQLATRHLLKAGHKRIALVLDEVVGWGVEQRIAGYRDTLRGHVEPDFEPVVLSSDTMSSLEIARHIIAQKCTACVNLTDNYGFAVLDSLTNELGLRIPNDISVVCLENEAISQFTTPRLTTIAQPLREIAETVVQAIVWRTDDTKPGLTRTFKSYLVERDSVRRLDGAGV
jgi:LacI family transcriptional regulator